LRAQLLMAFHAIRSERQLMEQIDYNLPFRWLVGFSMDDESRDHSAFTKNRNRSLGGEVACRFFAQVQGRAERADLLSKEHFSVHGTPIEALASLTSYRPKDEDSPPRVAVAAIPRWTFTARSAAAIAMNQKATLRCANVTPRVAQNTSSRSSATDGRTTRHAGCATS